MLSFYSFYFKALSSELILKLGYDLPFSLVYPRKNNGCFEKPIPS